METKTAAIHQKIPILARQLPITGSAHKAAIVGNALMPAVLAGIDMAAECCRAAVLNRRHDLELGQAQVTGLGGTIAGSFSSEDIGDSIEVRKPLQPPGSSPCINNVKRSRGLVTERIVLVATRA